MNSHKKFFYVFNFIRLLYSFYNCTLLFLFFKFANIREIEGGGEERGEGEKKRVIEFKYVKEKKAQFYFWIWFAGAACYSYCGYCYYYY